MKDVTESIVDPSDWEPHQVICRKKIDETRGNPQICLCYRCRNENDERKIGIKNDT